MTTPIPIDLIDPNPWQTRHSADHEYIQELANDIQANGLLQAPMGRYVGTEPDVRVQLAFGHNRLEAYRLLAIVEPEKWGEMPVEVRELTDEQLADYAWSENERRREHTPLDRANAIQRRIQDFGWTLDQVAQHLLISRPAVSNALRLLKLPADLLPALGDGRLSERAAIALLSLFDLPESLRKDGEEQYDGDIRPSLIVRAAINGESSEVLRNRVARLAGRFSRDLGQAPWKIGADLPGLGVRAPVCKTCEMRLAERNLCTDPGCYRAKEALHTKSYLEAASQASGILPVEDVGASLYDKTTFDSSWGTPNKNDLAPLRAAGCTNLRLGYRENGSYPEVTLKDVGFPKAMVFCQKRSGYCTCAKGLQMQRELAKRQLAPAPEPASIENQEPDPVEADPPQTSEQETPADVSIKVLEELAKKARQEKREMGKLRGRARAGFARYFADLIQAGDLRAWRLLAAEVAGYRFGAEKTKEMELEPLLYELGLYLSEHHEPWEPKSIHDILACHNDHLKKFELGPIELAPEGETLAAIFDDADPAVVEAAALGAL